MSVPPNSFAVPPGPSVPTEAVESPSPNGEATASRRGWPLIPGYKILAELGSGGMGVVYQARQVSLNRTVALKTILHGGQAKAELADRFRREAEAVARLQHPNVVEIYDFGEHDGLPYFTMQFVEGVDLDRKLQGTPVAARSAARLVETLARAMHHVHERGPVLHRDLKPKNIMLEGLSEAPLDQCVPKITDFGLAKPLSGEGEQTASTAVVGTPSYMAPEQAQGSLGGRLTPATDVYALGAILYECLTGRPPFRAETPVETLLQVLEHEPVAPRQLQSKVPRDLETICLKCLRKEAHKRYPTASALADDLERFLEGKPIHARRVGVAERTWRWVRRHRAATALIAATIVSIVAGLAARQVAVWEERQRAEQDADRVTRYHSLVNRINSQIDRNAEDPQPGWTFETLDNLRQAIEVPTSARDVVKLRSYAVQCFGAVDLREIRVLAEGFQAYCVAFSRTGDRLAIGQEKGFICSVLVYDVGSRDGIRKLPVPEIYAGRRPGVHSLVFSPDGRWLVVAAARSTFGIPATNTGTFGP